MPSVKAYTLDSHASNIPWTGSGKHRVFAWTCDAARMHRQDCLPFEQLEAYITEHLTPEKCGRWPEPNGHHQRMEARHG
jgi:hypothetical protein